MAAPERFAKGQILFSCTAGAVHTWHQPAVVRDQPYARYGRELRTLLDRARPPPFAPAMGPANAAWGKRGSPAIAAHMSGNKVLGSSLPQRRG